MMSLFSSMALMACEQLSAIYINNTIKPHTKKRKKKKKRKEKKRKVRGSAREM
jgi:hypothetical protein